MSEFYYEVHITRVLHTARISNVDGVMFVIRIREMVSFERCQEIKKDFFPCPTLVTRRKTSFSISLPSSKLTISISLYTVNILEFSWKENWLEE